MYKSPVEIIYGQMQTQMEGDIIRAIQSYGINVDKEELIQAMQYDRHQYDKGYADGKRDAMDSIVRCKDCIYNEKGSCMFSQFANPHYRPDYFCADGERKDNERKTD